MDQTERWQRMLADARSVDKKDIWERTKILTALEAAVVIDLITRQQADYARGIVLEGFESDETNYQSEPFQTELWNKILADAKAVDKEDYWARTKVVVGLQMFVLTQLITKEQADYILEIVIGHLDLENCRERES